ncbi:MAG: histidinol-phosphate transaminase [Planctomycetes bacterium]|nr:histidinol-phosphate transaminase [Planctomycetota bacterium]
MSQFLRAKVFNMAGYTPGEQPRDADVVKLNTNENPYPPSPCVAAAISELLHHGRLRKYPDPLGQDFCQVAGRILGVDPASILIGNGSDDILTILTRAFVPESGLVVSPTPSYLLYKTLADLQGAAFQAVPFAPNWSIPEPWPVRDAHLTFVANPNSPSGTMVPVSALENLAQQLRGPLVIDEAYIDFADATALPLCRLANVIVTRTLSKSYSLAGLRFGFAVAQPEMIRQLTKVKDSYNCDALSLAGAAAALDDQEHMLLNRTKILATRGRLTRQLRALGFQVEPSQANFVWVTRSDRPVKPIFETLKGRKILVRFMDYGVLGDGLRISVGTDAEIDRLLNELQGIV